MAKRHSHETEAEFKARVKREEAEARDKAKHSAGASASTADIDHDANVANANLQDRLNATDNDNDNTGASAAAGSTGAAPVRTIPANTRVPAPDSPPLARTSAKTTATIGNRIVDTTGRARILLSTEEKAQIEEERQEDFKARQQAIDDERAEIANELNVDARDIDFDHKLELDARLGVLDRQQAVLDREKLLPPGAVAETRESGIRKLIYDLERAASKGHGLSQDKELMAQAAAVLREAMGMTMDETMITADAPLGPVVKERPMGHTLPGPEEPLNEFGGAQVRHPLASTRVRPGRPAEPIPPGTV